MTDDPNESGSNVFLLVLGATAPLAEWLVMEFFLDVVIERWIPKALGVPSEAVHGGLLALLFVGTWWWIRSLQRRHPRFLRTPPRYSFYDALVPMALWGIVCYVVLGVTLGLASYVLVNRTDEHWFFVVYAFALWVPVWLAMPMAALIARRRESQ